MEAFQKNPSRVSEELTLISEWCENELKLNPEKGFMNFPLGMIYFEVRNLIPARECFQKAIQYFDGKETRIAAKVFYHSDKRIKKIDKMIKKLALE
jgi:hypothetical protein